MRIENSSASAGLHGENLAAMRGERLIFAGISFTLPPGGALLLLGANGSGKSTLLRIAAGLLPPSAGTLRHNGTPLNEDHARNIAYLGHQDAIKPGLTAAGNLRFAATGGGDIMAALDSVGLADLAALPARMLSAGQRRRLAIARLKLAHAPVWLLDEPTLGLDTESVARFAALLAAHREAGGSVMAATHLPLPLPHCETRTLG
jgi:heme exporter protein A